MRSLWNALFRRKRRLLIARPLPPPPPRGWYKQEQWFTAEGDYFNRIIFYTIPGEGSNSGFTVNLRNENGALVVAEHFLEEECSAGVNFFEIQKTVKYGERYCFEVVADEGGSSWAVPYLYVPGGELSAWEEASLDGVPIEGGNSYLFLSFFYAQISYAAVGIHVVALLAGAVYLFFHFFGKKKKEAWSMDVAMLCIACACAAGQFFLCKNYYLSKTLLLCLPCVFLMGIVALGLVRHGHIKLKMRISLHSWKTAVFLVLALLLAAMLFICMIGKGFASIRVYLYFSSAVFLVFLFLGLFSLPRFDAFCARFPWFVYVVESVLIFLQMEISNANPWNGLNFLLAFWNLLIIFSLFALLWGMTGNFRTAGMTGILLFAVWGTANSLTVEFRGIPISPGDLMSAGTAFNVLDSYRFELNIGLTSIFMLIALEILLLLRIPVKANKNEKAEKKLRQRGIAIVCTFLFFWQGCFGALDPSKNFAWEWNSQLGYWRQGYTATSVLKIQKLFIKPPAGYTPEAVQMLCEKEEEQLAAVQTDSAFRPNIILIMNESWFDWRQVTVFETDKPVMPFIDNLENCIRGFAVGPQDRSGTSLSEYELLTSNSLSMMPEVTPFTQRNLEGSYSVVSYLEALGYTADAIHPAQATNYNRKVVYPQLGFGNYYAMDDPLFLYNVSNVHGFISDSSAFNVVKTLFEEKDTAAPKLLYLLTIQNHGGYDKTQKVDGVRSDVGGYTINLESGFDEIKNAAEEYLSIVHCTDAAFEDLIHYFQNCDEPTIVCMVGDHGPLLGGDAASPYEGYEWNMRQRGTPFVIWANYPIESYDAGYIGLVQLVPLLMQTAELPLSPFYQTILDLSKEYPVLNAAFYQDANGNFGDYSYIEEIPQSELLRQYVYFEYNSLLPQEKRIKEIFLTK